MIYGKMIFHLKNIKFRSNNFANAVIVNTAGKNAKQTTSDNAIAGLNNENGDTRADNDDDGSNEVRHDTNGEEMKTTN